MALFILGAVAVPLSYGMPTPANSSGVRADPRLCEALEAGLPAGCIVGPECFGFVCLTDMFQDALLVEATLDGVCDAIPSVRFAIQRVGDAPKTMAAVSAVDSKKLSTRLATQHFSTGGNTSHSMVEGCYDITLHQCDCNIPDREACLALNEPGQQRFFWTPGCTSCTPVDSWEFEWVNQGPAINSTRRMAGLEYAVSACEDSAAGYANGRIGRRGPISPGVLTDVSLALDACCAEDDGTVPDGCYDISLHQCDCGVVDERTCNALNLPGTPQRFFWTSGCASCAGRDVCGSALMPGQLPKFFLDAAWSFDFTQACA